jgi:hypothetical protein
MSIVRIGSNDKYASGWSLAFGGGKKSAAKKASPKKKTAKKAKRK